MSSSKFNVNGVLVVLCIVGLFSSCIVLASEDDRPMRDAEDQPSGNRPEHGPRGGSNGTRPEDRNGSRPEHGPRGGPNGTRPEDRNGSRPEHGPRGGPNGTRPEGRNGSRPEHGPQDGAPNKVPAGGDDLNADMGNAADGENARNAGLGADGRNSRSASQSHSAGSENEKTIIIASAVSSAVVVSALAAGIAAFVVYRRRKVVRSPAPYSHEPTAEFCRSAHIEVKEPSPVVVVGEVLGKETPVLPKQDYSADRIPRTAVVAQSIEVLDDEIDCRSFPPHYIVN